MLLKEFLEHGNIEHHVIVDRYYCSNSLDGYTVDDAEKLMTKNILITELLKTSYLIATT